MRPSSKGFVLAACAAILIAVPFLTFNQVRSFDFVNWDDDLYVYHNPDIRAWTYGNVVDWFSRPYITTYVPVPMASYALDHYLFGMEPGKFHETNLTLHLINGLLVFAIFVALGGNVLFSCLGALLFSLHPAQVESVAWISQRKNLLFALFFLAGFLLLMTRGTKRKAFLPAALLCFLFSLLSKATAVVAPLLILGFDYFFRETSKRQIMLLSLFLILPAAALGLFTLSLYPEVLASFQWAEFIERLEGIGLRGVYYVKLVFFPVSLDLFYDETWKGISASVLGRIFWCFSAAMLFAWFLFQFIRKNLSGFWLFWFFVFLLPVVNVFPVPVGDRHLYLPLAGIAGFLVFALQKKSKRAGIIVLSVIVGALAPMAYGRTKVWSSSESLWDSVRFSRARELTIGIQRAGYYEDQGDMDKAARIYWGLIRLAPETPYAYINLYNLYILRGNEPEAALVAEAFHRDFKGRYELPSLYRELVAEKSDPEKVNALISDVTRSKASQMKLQEVKHD